MTVTTLEPTTIEHLDLEPVCQGTITSSGGDWEEVVCSSTAEIVKIKRCGCVVLHCMPCRNKMKNRIESAIAASPTGRHHFFCTLCMTDFPGVESYWGMVDQEVPL